MHMPQRLALAVTLSLPAWSLAAPFSIFEARGYAMGGAGVASSEHAAAALYNPALLAAKPDQNPPRSIGHDDRQRPLRILARTVGIALIAETISGNCQCGLFGWGRGCSLNQRSGGEGGGQIACAGDNRQIDRALTGDRKSTRLNSSHTDISRMPSSA